MLVLESTKNENMITDNHALLIHPEMFDSFWEIMTESFPENERKTSEEYIKQLRNEHFAIKLQTDTSANIQGFIGYWQLDGRLFVEHFAVSSKYRNQGLGGTIFSRFLESTTLPVVLEVEPPQDELARRRIKFYERFGFVLNSFPYLQPSYHPGGNAVELRLMTNDNKLTEVQFRSLRDEIYQTVYNTTHV